MTSHSEGMTCGEFEQAVTSYLEGALSAPDRVRFEDHCRVCPLCRTRAAQSESLVRWLATLEDNSPVANAAQKEALTALFREHGFHRAGRPTPRVRLGPAGPLAAPGDHLAYLWESEQEFTAMTRFIAVGAAQGETCLLLGHEEANERLNSAIGLAGVDAAALKREDRLRFLSGVESAEALFDQIGEMIVYAVDRGAPLVRILGNLGWGKPGWPADRDILRLEARLTEAVRKLPVVVMCAYDTRSVPGPNLFRGGIECHPFAFRRNVLTDNPLYVPADLFLASLPPNGEK